MEMDPKTENEFDGNSIYHIVMTPVRVLWKILSQILFSLKEFYEHQRWKVMMWFDGSSPTFPSNFRMLDGSLVGMGS